MSVFTTHRRQRHDGYEDPYYWSTGAGFYEGKYPPWFDDVNPAKDLLERNYEVIKAEVLDFYERQSDRLRPNWLQWGYTNHGWLTLDLYSYRVRKPRNCRRFPTLDAIARQVPGMMLVQVGVLQPNTRIRPHVSETNAMIRSHLPLVVPGGAPDLGLRVGAETRCWEEGKVIAINIAYRHCAWNLTDQPRIVVVVDCIHPDFADRIDEVASNGLALSAMKGLASSIPVLKDAPQWVTEPTRAVVAAAFRVLLLAQRRLRVPLPAMATSLRPPGRRKQQAA